MCCCTSSEQGIVTGVGQALAAGWQKGLSWASGTRRIQGLRDNVPVFRAIVIFAKQCYSKQVAQGYGGWAMQKRLS